MKLTDKQEKGLDIAVKRYLEKEKYSVISGFAGSGKSTLVKFIISALGQYDVDPDEDVCYCAFTGKACEVLRKKGNSNISTLHKLLYKSRQLPNGKWMRIPTTSIPYKILVIDEISMVPIDMIQLIAKFDVYCICLGDPFQLPPIDKKSDNHLLDSPHVFLDEIMRQAQESEIIRVSMAIRNGEPLSTFKGKEVQILNSNELTSGMLSWADQTLVATNEKRNQINNFIRESKGFPKDEIVKEDKIICLRNYWETISEQENALVNGSIGYCSQTFDTFLRLPNWAGGYNIKVCNTTLRTDDNDIYSNLSLDKTMILTGKKCVDWKTAYKMEKGKKTKGLLPLECAFGYAITTHKAQGSQWDNVLVIEEKFPFNKEEHARWLYTAVTRSSKKCVLIR